MVAERLMDDSLETVEVEEPEALVGLLRGLGSAPAPQVLDRLVAEESEAGPRAGVVRAVRELERQSAPSRLNAAPLAARTAKHRGKLALVAAALLVFVLGASNGWFQSDDRQPVFVPIDTLAFVSEDDESLTGFEARLQATSERPTRGSIKLTRLGRSLSMDAAPTTYLVALQGGTGMRVDSEQPLAPAQPLESLRKDSSSNVDQVEEEVQR